MHHNFSIFLNEGAILRVAPGTYWLWSRSWWNALDAGFAANKVEEAELYAPNFFENLSEYRPLRGQILEITEASLREILKDLLMSEDEGHFEPHWIEPSLEGFAPDFDTIQKLIASKKIQKAVPVLQAKTSGAPEMTDVLNLILKMLSLPESVRPYGYWNFSNHQSQGILGATPENLFTREGQKVKTMAFAGTLPKGEGRTGNELLSDPKELEEHNLVVKDIVNVLSKYGSVACSDTRVVELPALFHLQTDIELNMPDVVKSVDLMRELHPTPALGVYPRDYGFRWMQNLQQQGARRRFGAPFGIQNLKTDYGVFVVAIRNIEWNETETSIASGCGVISASEMNKEFVELSAKRESVKRYFGFT